VRRLATEEGLMQLTVGKEKLTKGGDGDDY
jgi:hypothetical protein